jgi:pyruvate-formate lyase-activating enzyme
MIDFANILLGGPCNRRCPYCIGRQLPERLRRDNLDELPPRGLERLIGLVNEHGIRDVVLTGTSTDPQLYRHEAALIALLRARLHPDARLALHSNGALALRRMSTFNRYDKVCLSLPSFEPAIYAQMMGSRRVPDLARILGLATVPVKLSCLVTDTNRAGLPDYLERCRELGVRRLVLRRLHDDPSEVPILPAVLPGVAPIGAYRGNRVYRLGALEVTDWCFRRTNCTCLNLFPDGTLSDRYRLAETGAEADAVTPSSLLTTHVASNQASTPTHKFPESA